METVNADLCVVNEPVPTDLLAEKETANADYLNHIFAPFVNKSADIRIPTKIKSDHHANVL